MAVRYQYHSTDIRAYTQITPGTSFHMRILDFFLFHVPQASPAKSPIHVRRTVRNSDPRYTKFFILWHASSHNRYPYYGGAFLLALAHPDQASLFSSDYTLSSDMVTLLINKSYPIQCIVTHTSRYNWLPPSPQLYLRGL